jgi:hypothetical protein
LPRIGDAGFKLAGAKFVGSAPVIQVLGVGQAALPVLGVVLLVNPLQPTILTTATAGGTVGAAGAGTVAFPVPVPDNPAFVGAEVDVQHVSFDAGGPAGFAASHGVTMLICPKL